MADFFDNYDRFIGTSVVGNWPVRLNLRHEAIIEANHALFKNSRVLDLASHDGRWSFAALQAGAQYVKGVEVRPELVETSKSNLLHFGIPRACFDFEHLDLNHLRNAGDEFDIVLCLGYFYHTLNHLALFDYMSSTNAKYLILDGMVSPASDASISLYLEEIQHHANGMSSTGTANGQILVGHPTVSALQLMARQYGYDVVVFDWLGLIQRTKTPFSTNEPHGPDNPIGDYADSRRATLLATKIG